MKKVSVLLLLVLTCQVRVWATFSIILIDQRTQQIGIAGASCSTDCSGIGSILPAKGAVIVQAMSNYNAHAVGRKAILAGDTPDQIIAGLQEARFDPAHQQYAVVTLTHMTPATYTGDSTIAYKGSLTGHGISVQGNLLTNPDELRLIYQAVRKGQRAGLPLGEILILALEAGAKAGGDRRCGDQKALSAFLKVARPTDSTDHPFMNLVVTNQPKGGLNAVSVLRQAYETWKKESH